MKIQAQLPNQDVYRAPEVVSHYASLVYVTPCERFLFERYVRRGGVVLDLGVGGGRVTPYLSQRASRYIGADYSAEMVSACQQKFPHLEFKELNAADLSCFADATFDAVVLAFNAIDYLSSEERLSCLSESHRVLKPSGVLIFSSHNPRALVATPEWNRERVRRTAERLSPAGFMVAPVAVLLGFAAALRALVRAAYATVARTWHMLRTRAFWRGEGYVFDPVHGGLVTHVGIPESVQAEVEPFGFIACDLRGDDFPRKGGTFVTKWYYYVFRKPEAQTGTVACAS